MATHGQTTWADIREWVGENAKVIHADGTTWTATWHRRDGGRELVRIVDAQLDIWIVKDQDIALLPTPPIPEPPDGTRIEFEFNTDVYAAWRDDKGEGVREPGHDVGDGKDVWLLYGSSIAVSWAALWATFGDSLRLAVRLTPVAEDLPKRRQWPTAIYARRGTTHTNS